MPTSTFTPGDHKQDEKLNPGQQEYDRRFNDIARAEEKGTFDDIANNYDRDADASQEDANIKKLQQGESEGSPRAPWDTNVKPQADNKKQGKGWFKRAAPALGIGGGLSVGGILFLLMTSPSLLFFQISSTMTEKFNTQLASMEARDSRLFAAKMSGATKGVCSNVVSIRCKFSTMSDKQVEKLKKAGIEVVGDEKTAITGRTKPTAFKFQNKTISAADFAKESSTNAAFRSALRQAYNPKYAGFAGKAWSAVAAKFKITKKPPELGGEDEAKARKKLTAIAAEGFKESDLDTGKIQAGDKIDPNCTKEPCAKYSGPEAENARALEADAKSGATAGKVRSALADFGGEVAKAGNVLKVTGVFDDACMAYSAINGLTYAAKAIRAAQLVRYAMVFLSVSDAIKAGQSPPQKDIEFLGNTLTATKKDPSDPTKTLIGSATDSFGYKYAAYTDSSASPRSMNIANRFMAGGGLVGQISTTSNTVLGLLGGRDGARNTCKILGNPLVQAGSLLAGVAMLFVPGANLSKIALSATVHITIAVAISMIPELLADIVAGSTTDGIIGEESGDAIASGSGKLLSDSLAGQNGAAPMTKADAIAYNSLQTQVTDRYIADEVQTDSPFDATNPHTFLGSITASLLPARSSSNPITTVGALLASSLKSLVPQSSALSTADYEKSLSVCNDMDAQEAGYATDPFCNVIRAIPPKYLNRDPVAVADQLINNSQMKDDGTPINEYADFISKCIEPLDPLGYGEDKAFSAADAKECIINDKNANYYLNYMDTRVEAGMSGEDNVTGADVAATTGRPENTTDRGGNGGWTLTNDVDYSKYQCDPRTTDAGTYKSPQYGWTIRLCDVTFNTSGSASNGGHSINSLISTNAMNMFEAAKAAGIDLGLSDGMRKIPPSYFSMHSTGLAMDLGTPRGGQTICYGGSTTNGYGTLANAEAACAARGGIHYAAYTWLRANASKYGFFNFDKEPWHYSTSGNGV